MASPLPPFHFLNGTAIKKITHFYFCSYPNMTKEKRHLNCKCQNTAGNVPTKKYIFLKKYLYHMVFTKIHLMESRPFYFAVYLEILIFVFPIFHIFERKKSKISSEVFPYRAKKPPGFHKKISTLRGCFVLFR